METKQRQVIDMIVEVVAFLAGHPAIDPASYAVPKQVLDEAVLALRGYAGAQLSGKTLKQAATEQAESLARLLVDWHIRPLVTIAQGVDEEGVLPRMTLPRTGLSFNRLIAFADSVVDTARPYEARFVEAGRPADFLAQLTAARNDLEAALATRATQRGKQIGATKGIQVQLRKSRAAVKRIDALVRIAYGSNPVVLERWKAAKRVVTVRATNDLQAAATAQSQVNTAPTAA
jgi:hypothetical protein